MLGDGAARGATPGPSAPFSRSKSSLSRLLALPTLLLPSSSSGTPRANTRTPRCRGRPFVDIRSVIPSRFSPVALYSTDRRSLYFGLILSHPSSYSFTLLFLRTFPILYHALLSHSLFPVSSAVFLVRYPRRIYFAKRVVDLVRRRRRFLRRGRVRFNI